MDSKMSATPSDQHSESQTDLVEAQRSFSSIESEFDDEAYDESGRSSDWTSIVSDIRRGVLENGRLYPSYGRHQYSMPVDEQELDRNDLQHCKFTLLLGNQLFMAPISDSPMRILDIGTGSGIWAIDMGDLFPGAEVIGTDIAPVQPDWVAPNVQFFIEDAEDVWTFSHNSFDFVFSREMSFAIRNWPQFISQAWTTLRPGGWIELSATHPQTQCDDQSLDLHTSYLASTARAYLHIAEGTGASLEAPKLWSTQLKEAGFVDIQESWIKMPLGRWPRDKHLKKVGTLELASLDNGFEAYMIRGWTQVLGKSAAECYALLAEARKEANNPKYHTYCYFVVVFGRKPQM